MKKMSFFPVLYMFVITAVLSAILIVFSEATRDRVESNQQFDFEQAVVAVLPTGLDMQTASQMQIHKVFTEKVTQPDSAGGAYVYQENGEITGYALPIDGQGFWAPIKGMLGVAPDKKTLTGIAIYEQNETPGLGAEITEPQFKNQFDKENNVILAQQGNPIKLARPGTDLKQNEVHAVTGATQTSVRLEKLINEDVEKWRQALNSDGDI